MPEQQPERRLSERDLRSLQDRIGGRDSEAERLGIPSHYGSIEAAEERRFPWLKQRRNRRAR